MARINPVRIFGPGDFMRGAGRGRDMGFNPVRIFGSWGLKKDVREAHKRNSFNPVRIFGSWGPDDEAELGEYGQFQSGADFWVLGTVPRFARVLSWANAGPCVNLSREAAGGWLGDLA